MSRIDDEIPVLPEDDDLPSTFPTAIADDIPMTVDQMQRYLRDLYGFPAVLRQQGTTKINCPCGGKPHDHSPETGHHPGGCQEPERNDITLTLTIGNQSFIPNCGCTTMSYVPDNGVNKLLRSRLATFIECS